MTILRGEGSGLVQSRILTLNSGDQESGVDSEACRVVRLTYSECKGDFSRQNEQAQGQRQKFRDLWVQGQGLETGQGSTLDGFWWDSDEISFCIYSLI